ncbi:hypothetical protein FHW96_000228 [Novosphingobium sp. SG751A]|uniref:hypothetical protein n=1 Tax=Novosphingobium sp. SG751A TaxID=2587000 RepID=UPI0015558B68|nr:hypothetical protein [Novosphingobium sp. SG751A]NOW44101.1 hypothetical protein [Novosphingobium sp. SG751A]
MTQTVENLSATLSFLASVEPAARRRLAQELGDLGEQALAVQMAAAPVRTGRLRDALTVAQAISGLRVRVGYPDLKSGRDPRFYAIMQEGGVKAGEKTVTRLNKRKGRTVQKGRVKVYPRSTYIMHWRAREGRHFVHQESRFDQLLIAVQDRFWAETLNDVGA